MTGNRTLSHQSMTDKIIYVDTGTIAGYWLTLDREMGLLRDQYL